MKTIPTIPNVSSIRCGFTTRLLIGLLFFLGAFNNEAQGWLAGSWQFRAPVLVDPAAGGSNLVGYQVKIVLTAANFNFANVLTNGADIRVTDSDGTTLIPYYILQFDVAQQRAIIWVRVPVLTPGVRKTLFIYYGNAAPPRFTLPPTGLFWRPPQPLGSGLVENMVYDSVTGYYYIVYGIGGLNTPFKLARATVPWGTWTYVGDILMPGTTGSWDDTMIYAPHLVKYQNVWYLYYTGTRSAIANGDCIGVATSSSILGPYLRYSGNPILANSGKADWEQFRASEPFVFLSTITTQWTMLYMGDAGDGATEVERVGYATASNPLGPWVKSPRNPIIDYGPVPSWDSAVAADPFVVEVDGTAYIFYTGSSSSTLPWFTFPATTGFATTRDFTNFTKGHVVYGRGAIGEWDQAQAFRGAIMKGPVLVNDMWFFPYSSASAGWSVAIASAISTDLGYDPFQVFDYYDEFTGTALDPNKWGHPTLPNEGGDEQVNGGILTLRSGIGTFRTLVGRREFGVGYVAEFVTRHPSADGLGLHSAQVGLSLDDRTGLLRILDYNSPFWLGNASTTLQTVLDTTLPLATPLDQNWHRHSIAFVAKDLVRYRIDDNPWQDITTTIPPVSLKPWLFVFSQPGTQTTLEVDSVVVRHYAQTEPVVQVTAIPSGVPPVAPSGLSVTPVSGSQINLAWVDNSADETGFKIERKTGAGGTYAQITTVGANVTAFNNTGLTNGTTYFYRVRAANAAGDSAYSSEASATTTTVPNAPSGLMATPVSGSQINLSWVDNATNETGYKIERKTGAGGTYAQIATVGANVITFSNTGLISGTTYFYRVRATNAVDDSAYSSEASATTIAGAGLPSPWSERDIGSIGVPGSASYSNGTFTVSGSGSDIWDIADAFHFVSQPLTGNGEIIARVRSVQNTDPWAKAGVMIRESFASSSTHAMMVVTSGNGLAFQRRLSSGGTSTHTGGATVTAPYWVRLVRIGNTFTGYASSDGVSWTQVGSDTVVMSNSVQVGIAVTAHNNAALNTAILDNVSVTTPPDAPGSLVVFAASGSQVNLTWVDNATNETGFKIERKTGTGGTYAPIATVDANVTAFNDTGLANGTTYFYRVRATNAAGDSAYSSEASATTPAAGPAAPSSLIATPVSGSQINLSWVDNATNETGYKIERKTGAGGIYAQIATVGSNVITFSNTGLISGTTYFYRVRATNAVGDSAYSSEASATTTAPAFRAASSKGAASGVNTLTINKPTDTQSGDVIVASIAIRPNTATITASGWILVRRIDNANANANSLAVYYKVAGASEPASYSWTFSTSTGSVGGIQSFSGIDTANPVDVEAGQNTASGLTLTAPSVTTRFASDMIVTSHAFSSCASFTPPSGMTEALDISSDPVPASTGEAIEGNYRLQPAVAATGALTANASNDADIGNAHTLALKAK